MHRGLPQCSPSYAYLRWMSSLVRSFEAVGLEVCGLVRFPRAQLPPLLDLAETRQICALVSRRTIGL